MKTNTTRNWIIGGAAALLLLAGGGAYAIADESKDEEQERTLTAAETQKAEAAAAREVDGQILYVEYEEDHGGGYEVEIQLKNGSEAEVYLDKSFKVVGVERDDGEHGEKGGRDEHREDGKRGDNGEHPDYGYGMESRGSQDGESMERGLGMQGGKGQQ